MAEEPKIIVEDEPTTPKGTKFLYRVEIWEENKEDAPVATRHLYAISPAKAKTELKFRAIEEAKLGKYLLTYLLSRDDVCIVPVQTEDTRSIAKKERGKFKAIFTCQNCGTTLDDDYCQSCGWRRQSWIERAMEKQGETETGGE